MKPYTNREKVKIAAGAVAALVTTAMLYVIAMSLLLP